MFLVYLKKHGGGYEVQKWTERSQGPYSQGKETEARIIKAIELTDKDKNTPLRELEKNYPLKG